ncbi:MAG: sulfurtransferase TusA family protein [Beijerinckiaceae bacterium]
MDIEPTRSLASEFQSIDARGLKCPLPVLHARRALTRLAPGGRVEVLCTDPVSVIDIPHLAQEMGFSIVETEHQNGEYRFVIGPPA